MQLQSMHLVRGAEVDAISEMSAVSGLASSLVDLQWCFRSVNENPDLQWLHFLVLLSLAHAFPPLCTLTHRSHT